MLCKKGPAKKELSLFGCCTILGILAEVCCLVTYNNVFLLCVILRLHFVAARDTETRRAWQQQQTNANAAAQAALQAQHEETTRLAGDYEGVYSIMLSIAALSC